MLLMNMYTTTCLLLHFMMYPSTFDILVEIISSKQAVGTEFPTLTTT
jgi:hypothetical protein